MVNIQEAIARLSELIWDRQEQFLPLSDSLGSYVSEAVNAPMDVPNFDNSAMDGFALCWENEIPSSFNIVGVVGAGDCWPTQLNHGEAVRIFTGAPIPKGCNSVIQQEWSIVEKQTVRFTQEIRSNLNIRKMGSQTRMHDTVVSPHFRINSSIMGLLASLGINNIKVFNQVNCSIIITGNELVEIGNPLSGATIYNSNGPMLQAMLSEKGIRYTSYVRCLDNPDALKACIQSEMLTSSVILLTGGISVGDFDFVKSSLESLGVQELFYKVKQKPGKPLYIGKSDTHVFIALPGNPGSVHACFHAWVNPLLQQLNGGQSVSEYYQQLPMAVLTHDIHKKPGLTHFVKARVSEKGITVLTGQESYNLSSFNAANALAIIPEMESEIAMGCQLSYIPL